MWLNTCYEILHQVECNVESVPRSAPSHAIMHSGFHPKMLHRIGRSSRKHGWAMRSVKIGEEAMALAGMAASWTSDEPWQIVDGDDGRLQER